MSRVVICHYHIFKNAGTTFEKVLDDNYGDQHLKFDGPFSYFNITQDQLVNIIDRNPDKLAFSSHQIHIPTPTAINFTVVPVVFLRHPILRIRSIFLFGEKSKQQQAEASMAAEDAVVDDDPLARFADWVEASMQDRNRRLTLSNAQTNMLCRQYNQAPRVRDRKGRLEYDLYTAIRNIESIPCLGRTEHFDRDTESFAATFQRFGVEFQYTPTEPQNVSSSDARLPVDQQLENLRSRLTPELWQALLEINNQDLELYEVGNALVEKRLEENWTPTLPRHFGQ
jgi:hypothetical protein